MLTTTTVPNDVAAEVAMARQLARPVVVMVSREVGGWIAEVAALGVLRRARRLVALDVQVRELLGTGDVDYQFHTGDTELDRLILRIRAARAASQLHERRAQRLTGRALALPSGGTVRDLGLLLGLSHQRVHQLLRRRAAGLSSVEG